METTKLKQALSQCIKVANYAETQGVKISAYKADETETARILAVVETKEHVINTKQGDTFSLIAAYSKKGEFLSGMIFKADEKVWHANDETIFNQSLEGIKEHTK